MGDGADDALSDRHPEVFNAPPPIPRPTAIRVAFIPPPGMKKGTEEYYAAAIEAGYFGVRDFDGQAFKMIDRRR